MVVLAPRLLPNLPTEDGHVLLVCKGFLVVDEEEMAHFLQVQHYVAAVFLMDRTALHDAGQLKSEIYITGFQNPSQPLVEPSGVLQRVVVIQIARLHFQLYNIAPRAEPQVLFVRHHAQNDILKRAYLHQF